MNVLKTDVTPGTDESEGLNESSSTNGHAPCTKKKSKHTVSTDPMHVTLSPRMPPDVLESDSEGEIGVRKVSRDLYCHCIKKRDVQNYNGTLAKIHN